MVSSATKPWEGKGNIQVGALLCHTPSHDVSSSHSGAPRSHARKSHDFSQRRQTPSASPLEQVNLAPPSFPKHSPSPKPHHKSSFLRYLFPHTRQRARARLADIRHETLPALKHRAQSRIYRYIINRQTRAGKGKGLGILALLRKRGGRFLLGEDAATAAGGTSRSKMTSRLLGDGDAREPGARRKKLAGYLKAANDLRQSYQASYMNSWGTRATDVDNWGDDTPGAFPDAAVVRNGEEEMIIFPSYARKHVKRKPQSEPGTIQEASGAGRDVRDTVGQGDAEFWKQQWEEYEDDNAIVDVDVRGWIYVPHRGQMTRKHRIFIGLARQLSGIPAPAPSQGGESNTASSSRGSSPHPTTHHERAEARAARREERMVSKEAEQIVRKGEAETDAAQSGHYSEKPPKDSDRDSLENFSGSEDGSDPRKRVLRRETDPAASGITKRPSWNEPSDMTPVELKSANEHLMARLRPFMSTPVANTPISAFFYNEKDSRQRTINTDASGHFSLRAALDFIPTHVRVLASDKLSVTEEVAITNAAGVSLISDIDDTIKHSGIGSGAREIFRNAFIRELGDLTVEGVKDWYHQLADMGVKFHYVSNSPWQLYPVLTQYFSLAGLPPGSFHLKQYSGMLQGIFEPVAERKKVTLDRLARDFPERKFILVGDSGEADLEVYTDFVMENRGKVLGIFIRDVTTTAQKGFFDPSVGPLNNNRPANGSSSTANNGSRQSAAYVSKQEEDDPDLKAAIEASLRDMEEENKRISATAARRRSPEASGRLMQPRPELPPRRPTEPPAPESHQMDAPVGDLISLSSDEERPPTLPTRPAVRRALSDNHGLAELEDDKSGTPSLVKATAPSVPRKPLSLRKYEATSQAHTSPKPSPPPLPKPRRAATTTQITQDSVTSGRNSPINSPQYDNSDSYASQARQKLSSVYNSLPSWNTTATDMPVEGARTMSTSSRGSGSGDQGGPQKQAPPPPPPRRGLTSYPAAAASYATNRLSSVLPSSYGQEGATSTNSNSSPSDQRRSTTNFAGGGGGNGTSSNTYSTSAYTGGGQQLNKREEMWRRRWARAESIMRNEGVVLKTWRTGTDVADICAELVKKAKTEMEIGGNGRSRG